MDIRILPAQLSKKAKLRVCAYVRVSTDSIEQEGSLENQIQFFEEYIKTNPEWEFVEVYYDQGISGYRNDRENFQRMLDDARNGRIDLIVVKSISRFARNTETMLNVTRELKNLGIGVYFMLQNLNTLTASGELMLTIRGAFAQAESEVASDNTRLHIRRRFEAGIPCEKTRDTYGYKPGKQDHEMIPFENEATIVRLIYDMAEKGVWVSKIRTYLNNENIPSPTGGKWGDRTITRILHNVLYKGDLILQKTFKDSKRKSHPNKGQAESWYITANHEAIITPAQWDRVQVVLQNRAQHLNTPLPPKPKVHRSCSGTYPLSRKLHCPYCGAVLHHFWSNQRREYWACSTNIKVSATACKGIWVPASAVEGWNIAEPVVVVPYNDTYGMKHFTAYPQAEYKFGKEPKHAAESHSTQACKT